MNPMRERVRFVWLVFAGKITDRLESLEGFHRLAHGLLVSRPRPLHSVGSSSKRLP